MIVMVIVMIVVMIVISIAVLVTVAVSIPPMIVFKTAAIPFPVTSKKLLSVMMRSNPVCTLVWRPGPIPFMPSVVPSDRIPIAFYPKKIGPWTARPDMKDTGRWRRSNSDSERNLTVR